MIRIANNACSWGVWFLDDPKQPSWETYLDELKQAGYTYSELGTYGWIPDDSRKLEKALRDRGVRPLCFTTMTPFWDDAVMPEALKHIEAGCRLLRKIGAPYYVLIDAMYTDLITDKPICNPELTDEQFDTWVRNYRKVAALIRSYGIKPVFHPHACTHFEREDQIERFIDAMPKDELRLCLDTGHHIYVKGNDLFKFTEKHIDQIDYLHFKDLNPEVKERCCKENIGFVAATSMDLFAEVGQGSIDWKAYGELLNQLEWSGYACLERDCYPPTPGECLKEQTRTLNYLESIGLGVRD